MAIYSFIAEEQANNRMTGPSAEMCRILEVSRSGFYDWQAAAPSEREVTDRHVGDRDRGDLGVLGPHLRGTAGASLARESRDSGWAASGWLGSCAVNGWEGETGRRRIRTTIVDRGATAADDLVGRDFNPTAPDRFGCGDITYLRTGEGWLFLATVIDLFSRRVIGWSVADHMRTELVADALKMAVATRGGAVDAGVVFHTDRGSQYTSAEFGELCDAARS